MYKTNGTNMSLDCNFKNITFSPFYAGQYSCELQKTSEVVYQLTIITRINGDHWSNKSANQVNGFRAQNMKFFYFPINLHKHFETINIIHVIKCGLKEISQNDISGFDQLFELNLSGNKLTILKSNLFVLNMKLRVLNVRNNKIVCPFQEVLNHLSELSDLDLRDNSCPLQTSFSQDKETTKNIIKFLPIQNVPGNKQIKNLTEEIKQLNESIKNISSNFEILKNDMDIIRNTTMYYEQNFKNVETEIAKTTKDIERNNDSVSALSVTQNGFKTNSELKLAQLETSIQENFEIILKNMPELFKINSNYTIRQPRFIRLENTLEKVLSDKIAKELTKHVKICEEKSLNLTNEFNTQKSEMENMTKICNKKLQEFNDSILKSNTEMNRLFENFKAESLQKNKEYENILRNFSMNVSFNI